MLSAMLDKKIMKEAELGRDEVYVLVLLCVCGDGIKRCCDICHDRTNQVLIMDGLSHIRPLLM